MGVCIVENLSRVFLFEWPFIHLWVMREYIVWVKGKEVTLKKHLGRMFCDCLAGRPYLRDTRENDSLARLFSFQSCTPHVTLSWLSFSWNPLILHLSLSLHQFNTKPNTIKFHKIQWEKLKKLQHFLLWNKANIKHSCKSQLYNLPLWLFHDKTPYNRL